MRLAVNIGYAARNTRVPLDLIAEAESLGFHSVWTAESYGADAVSPAAWILARTAKIHVGTAIMQIPARTPACAAMTAMGLSDLSGGRFILGLGASGPQVVEGWHGQSYDKPVTRTREYVEIVRAIMARERPVEFDGQCYQLPYRGAGATGLGKPLKSILEANTSIPIYTASFTPAGLRVAGEVADGVFPIWYNPERFDLFEPHLQKGFDKKPGKSLHDFDIAPSVPVVMGPDVAACRAPIKGFLALYIGGMGAREKNFYNDYARALGYEDAARRIQDLYLDGRKEEAAAAVPDRLVDEIALVGPKERIRDAAARWKEAAAAHRVGTMLCSVHRPEELRALAELFL
jgi:F420-dependent oxidoreductase-like protein